MWDLHIVSKELSINDVFGWNVAHEYSFYIFTDQCQSEEECHIYLIVKRNPLHTERTYNSVKIRQLD